MKDSIFEIIYFFILPLLEAKSFWLMVFSIENILFVSPHDVFVDHHHHLQRPECKPKLNVVQKTVSFFGKRLHYSFSLLGMTRYNVVFY